MKKKWIGLCLLTLCIISLLTACGNGGKNNTGNSKQDSLEIEDGTVDTESTENMMDSFVEQPLDLKNYSLDYELATDDQPFFFWNRAAKSEYGYYYFKRGFLMFYDIQSGRQVPLCNKADCTHNANSTECNAYFEITLFEGDSISDTALKFYEENLYLAGYDSEGYTCLYKVAADGSSREKYMRLYKAEMLTSEGDVTQMHWGTPDYCIHRGYVYFIYTDESMPKIRRMKLGDDEAEIVFETSGYRPNLYRMKAYGDYLFFQTGNYTDETCVETKGGIYAYNIHTGEIQLVRANAISTYVVANHTIYYKYNENTEFRSLDLLTLEDKLLLEEVDGFDLSVDENYVYHLSSDGVLSVYDHEGNTVCVVSNIVRNCYFGDGNYIFGEFYDFDNQKSYICVLKVSDFADGKAEWTYLE